MVRVWLLEVHLSEVDKVLSLTSCRDKLKRTLPCIIPHKTSLNLYNNKRAMSGTKPMGNSFNNCN